MIKNYSLSMRLSLVALVVYLSLSVGFGRPALADSQTATSSSVSMLPGLLIDNEWLMAHLADDNLRILDARSETRYRAGHVRGAVSLPVNATFGAGDRPDLVAPISRIQQLISGAGVDNATSVVIYDDGVYMDAARLFWVFEIYGHKRVAILNGGFPQWDSEQRPLATETVTPEPKRFVPTMAPNRLATKLSARLAIDDPGKIIIDARSTKEYQGVKSKAQRYGHIPNAISVPAKAIYGDVNGIAKIRSLPDLEQMYQDLDKSKKVITYCNKGKLAALTYFVLRNLDYDVAAYDGSWVEWGNDQRLPIVTPQDMSSH